MKTLKLMAATVTLIALTLIIFYSCKKTATNEAKEQKDLTAFYQQKIKDEPASATLTVNLPGKGYYGDINGNKITVTPGQTNRDETTSCPDPGNSEFTQSLVSITREFTCNVGYRFVVKYKITSEFYPQLTSSSGQPSKGRIKLVDLFGGQVYVTSTSTINPVITIQNNGVVGQNSNGDDMNEFLVTYRSEIISESTYNLSAAVQCNLTCYTDCPNYATLVIGFSSQQQVDGSAQNTLPCLRIDKVYWSPSTGTAPNYTPPSLAGCNPLGSSCFPYGYVYPDKQEIWFQKNSTDLYTGEFNLYLHYLGQPSTPAHLINYYDIWYIDPVNSVDLVPGYVQVRYRNVQTSTSNGGPCHTQPDGIWVYETWYIN